MRLTLRTLIAYRDGVLDEIDRKELGDKLRDSPVATELNGRIEDLLRDHTEDASIARAQNLRDANNIAEYIDNVFPLDQLKGYEADCLQNDTLLEETAACHQILILLASVEKPSQQEMDRMRARMYSLAER